MKNLNLIKKLLKFQLAEYLMLDEESLALASSLSPEADVSFKTKEGQGDNFRSLFEKTYPNLYCYSNHDDIVGVHIFNQNIDLNDSEYQFVREYDTYMQAVLNDEEDAEEIKINLDLDSKHEIRILFIKDDKSDDMNRIFSNDYSSNKNIRFLNTNILLYFIYGEYINWKYNKAKNEFYIYRNSDLIETFNKNQWRALLSDHKIYYNQKKFIVCLKNNAVKYVQKLTKIFDRFHIDYVDWNY